MFYYSKAEQVSLARHVNQLLSLLPWTNQEVFSQT